MRIGHSVEFRNRAGSDGDADGASGQPELRAGAAEQMPEPPGRGLSQEAVACAGSDPEVLPSGGLGPSAPGRRGCVPELAREQNVSGPTANGYDAGTGDDTDASIVPGDKHDDAGAGKREAELVHAQLLSGNEALQAVVEDFKTAMAEQKAMRARLEDLNAELRSVNSHLSTQVNEAAMALDDLANLVSSANIAALFLDRGMRIKRCTPGAATMFRDCGIDLGGSLPDSARGLDRQMLEQDAADVLERLIPVEREAVLADGTTYIVRTHPYRTNSHKIEGVVITFFDITKRREAEQALVQSKQRLRLAMDAVGMGSFRWDIAKDCGDCDAQTRKLLQYAPDMATSHANFLEQRIFADDRPAYDALVQEAIRPGGAGHFRAEVRVVLEDGEKHWMDIAGKTFFDDDTGQPTHMIGTVTDVTERRHDQEKLKENETLLRTLLEDVAQAFWQTDAQGKVVEDSVTWRSYTGQSLEEWLGEGWMEAIPEEERDGALRLWKETVERGTHLNAQYRLRKAGGAWHWTNVRAAPVRDGDGRVRKWVGMNIDIDAQKKTEESLQQSNQRLRKLIGQTAVGLVEADAEGRMTLVNRKFCEMLGCEEKDLLGRSVLEVTGEDWISATSGAIRRLARDGRDFTIEKQYKRTDGTLMWGQSSVGALRDATGGFIGIVAVVIDISERRLAEERLRHASLHDALTGLPNRSMLFEYASHALSHHRRHQRSAGLLFLDLDRFKPINDTHGHETGDRVLVEAARRLSGGIRSEDVAVRLGGDEFVVFLQDIGEARYASEVAMHILDAMSEPFHVGELSLLLSASIGIAVYPQDGEEIDALISHADLAMYQAKQNGRSNFHFFSPEYAAIARMQASIEQRLKHAVNNSGFHLCYQPIIDLRDGRVVSVEALLRWEDAEVGPGRFIPVAEATGMINPIGRWLLREASRQHRRWREAGMPSVPIAVNVSVVEFRDKGFAMRLLQVLREEGVDCNAIQLEMTETAVMEDINHAVETLAILKAAGIRILLDDFGTGYSSLAYLTQLPLDKIKIDRSFVSQAQISLSSRAVTNAMIALGRTLGLEVVAEGVETESALEFVRNQGCDQVQGFLLASPMSGNAFQQWHQERPTGGA